MNEQPEKQVTEITKEIKYPVRRPLWFVLIALILAIAFDQLFWDKTPGLVFLLTVLMILVSGFILALIEKKHVPWQSWLLMLPILAGAVMTVFRTEGFTNFTNVVISMYGLLLLAATFLSGKGFSFRPRDVFEYGFKLLVNILASPVSLLIVTIKKHTRKSPEERKASTRRVGPVLRGLMIALPLVLVLGALLASADLIFSKNVSQLFKWFDLSNLGELIFRTIYVLALAYMFIGAYIYALSQTAPTAGDSSEQSVLVKPFLGSIEALIVLGSINLLFATFLIIQFRYFFGGSANINFEGFTFAEYARKGFFELIMVALLSMLIFFTFSHVTKRDNGKTKWAFSLLGFLLMAQVGVMLLSAFQRLSLYEDAYGFTQLRLVTHVFIIWLAVLLLVTVVLELTRELPRLALAIFLISVGFMLTLNLLNVDAFIARQNLAHAQAGHDLDARFMVWSLGEDATPTLFDTYQDPNLDPETKELFGAVLACRSSAFDMRKHSESWVSWHASWQKSAQAYAQNEALLKPYQLREAVDQGWGVTLNGKWTPCYNLNGNNGYYDAWD